MTASDGDDGPTMDPVKRQAASIAACPACGADRVGRSTYCAECGVELPGLVRASVARRGLVVLFALTWTVLVVSLLVWLMNHTLILK